MVIKINKKQDTKYGFDHNDYLVEIDEDRQNGNKCSARTNRGRQCQSFKSIGDHCFSHWSKLKNLEIKRKRK
jgi:hypothetical protein|tara:strand:- start:1866 stop:2081 length:216 start_codon:yes stop_codon:yes gene_type:complete